AVAALVVAQSEPTHIRISSLDGIETVQVRKPRAIGIDGEHRARARTAAIIGRPIQGIARYNQSRPRISSVAASETVQDPETRAISIDGEHRAGTPTAAIGRCPIPDVAVVRYRQTGIRIRSVANGKVPCRMNDA